MTYILIGLHKDGSARFWTGKAGIAYASTSVFDAFHTTKEYAEAKRALFNQTAAVTGISWLEPTQVIDVVEGGA